MAQPPSPPSLPFNPQGLRTMIYSLQTYFLEDVDIVNFADAMMMHHSHPANNIDELIDSLEKTPSSLFKWFKDNLFKGKSDKCHLLVSTNEKIKISIGEFSIENKDYEKFIGGQD